LWALLTRKCFCIQYLGSSTFRIIIYWWWC